MSMRTVFILFFAMMIPAISSADPISSVRWKNRVIVLDFPRGSGSELSALETQIRRTKAEIKDRDLIIFHVGEKRSTGYSRKLTEEERKAVRSRLGMGTKSTSPRMVLIGKDGGVKATQTNSFDLTKFYRLIDTMPMRQKEMRER